MRKKLKFVLVPLAVVVLVMTIMGMAQTNKLLTLKQLNQIWNTYMVKGESGLFINGMKRKQLGLAKCRKEKNIEGKVSLASHPSFCIVSISVSEGRGKIFGVFGSGGGWGSRGGLLNFIVLEQTRYELYGKETNRFRPGVFDDHYKRRDTMFEFFLVKRNNGASEAVVVKEWKFSPDQVPDLKSIERHKTVLGFLTRENTDTLRVKILGVSTPVDETIQIGDTISKNR